MSNLQQQELLFNAVQQLSFENYTGLQPNGDENNFIEWDIKDHHEKPNQFIASTIYKYNDGDIVKNAQLTVEVKNKKIKIINIYPFVIRNSNLF